MYKWMRYFILFLAIVTMFPVKSEADLSWTIVDIFYFIIGIGIVVESFITIRRKGSIGIFQVLIGVPCYIIFAGIWTFRITINTSSIDALHSSIFRFGDSFAVILWGLLFFILIATIFNIYSLLCSLKSAKLGSDKPRPRLDK